MNRRVAIRSILAASAGSVFVPLLSRPLSADPPREQPQEAPFTLRAETRLVLLDVSVKTKQGKFVSGLAKDNFQVFEDGRRQQLTVFDHTDTPVTVGLLIDESQSMAAKRPDVIAAAEAFIADSNPQDEIFVLNFNDRVMPGLAPPKLFSGDPAELRGALYRGVPRGRTALNDAIAAGLRHLAKGRQDKKTLVVISDGGDNASDHRAKEITGMVERDIATIYTIGLLDTNDPDRNPGFLRRLAHISGGESYFPSTSAELKPVCHRIAQDIRARYAVGYLPRPGKDGLRSVRVRVDAPGHDGLSARTRTSYRYEKTTN